MKRIALLPEGTVSHEAIKYLLGDTSHELLFTNISRTYFRQ